MSETIHLSFQNRPALLPAFAKALVVPRPRFQVSRGVPHITAEWKNAGVDPQNYQNYLNVCELKEGENLPPLYPHILAFYMHMHIIAHAKFPFKVLGALHLRNHILQHRPIGAQEKGDFSCETAGFRILEKGLEFDINSIYQIKGERVWEEISTFFVKGRFGEQGEPSPLAEIETLTESEEIGKWHLPANRGKQYAKISGDYNPIHISPTLAKLFGFKRDLVHGFCVFATSIGRLPNPLLDEHSLRVDVSFKGPVFLDNPVFLKRSPQEKIHRFDLHCSDNPRPSICGRLENVASGSTIF